MFDLTVGQSAIIVPFLQFRRQAQDLDRYYYWTQSGDKLVSKIVKANLNDDGVLSTESRAQIARAFWETWGKMLSRQWENYIVEYEPNRPYDVMEETDYTHGNTSTVEDDGDVKVTKKGTVTNISGEQTGGSWVYGFDSTGEPTTTGGEGDSRFKTDNTYNRTIYGKDVDGSGETIDAYEDTKTLDTIRTSRDNSTDDLETHKYGSLGTMAMGDIMSKEFTTWMWNFFTQCLFPALDKMLTIPIY